jgi:hypothetical protein
MSWRPDPLLVALFESISQQLAAALEAQQIRNHGLTADSQESCSDAAGKIARLRTAIAELEGALERRDSRVIH